MEVLFALGLAVGGVDGVYVVEDLVHIHLPVAEDVPVVDGAEVPLLVSGVVDVLVVLLRVLLPHPVGRILLNQRTKITHFGKKYHESLPSFQKATGPISLRIQYTR
jgi:hypothetical protein